MLYASRGWQTGFQALLYNSRNCQGLRIPVIMNAGLRGPEQAGASGGSSWWAAATDSCPVSFFPGARQACQSRP